MWVWYKFQFGSNGLHLLPFWKFSGSDWVTMNIGNRHHRQDWSNVWHYSCLDKWAMESLVQNRSISHYQQDSSPKNRLITGVCEALEERTMTTILKQIIVNRTNLGSRRECNLPCVSVFKLDRYWFLSPSTRWCTHFDLAPSRSALAITYCVYRMDSIRLKNILMLFSTISGGPRSVFGHWRVTRGVTSWDLSRHNLWESLSVFSSI